MTTFAWLVVVFAAWFTVSVFAVVFLYACAIHLQHRREDLQERVASRVPDHVPVDWETEWLLDGLLREGS